MSFLCCIKDLLTLSCYRYEWHTHLFERGATMTNNCRADLNKSLSLRREKAAEAFGKTGIVPQYTFGKHCETTFSQESIGIDPTPLTARVAQDSLLWGADAECLRVAVVWKR